MEHEITLRTNYLNRHEFEQWLQCPHDTFDIPNLEKLFLNCIRKDYITFNEPCDAVEIAQSLYLVHRDQTTVLYEYPRWFEFWVRNIEEYLKGEEKYTFALVREAAQDLAREEANMKVTLYEVADLKRFARVCKDHATEASSRIMDFDNFLEVHYHNGEWRKFLDFLLSTVVGEKSPLDLSRFRDMLSLKDWYDGNVLVEIPMPYWIKVLLEALSGRTRGNWHPAKQAVPKMETYADLLVLLRYKFGDL